MDCVKEIGGGVLSEDDASSTPNTFAGCLYAQL